MYTYTEWLKISPQDGDRQNRELDKLIDAAAKIKFAGMQFLIYTVGVYVRTNNALIG